MRVVRHRGKLGAKTCVQRGLGQPAVILILEESISVLRQKATGANMRRSLVSSEGQAAGGDAKTGFAVKEHDLVSGDRKGTEEPMVNRELPKDDAGQHGSRPTRTLMVDSMPVGIAPVDLAAKLPSSAMSMNSGRMPRTRSSFVISGRSSRESSSSLTLAM